MSDHGSRKADHLDLCSSDKVAFKQQTTLLEEVSLLHDALPEMAMNDVDLTTSLVGKTLSAPVVIAAMTGGIDRAATINRDLAQVAEALGFAFGFGSMRPLLDDPKALGYQVRDVAPTATLFANLGIVQARDASTADVARLVESTGCDAICIHLNPAMEIIQPNGDEDFRGGYDTLSRLIQELPCPVIAKETGCGISRRVAKRLVEIGVEHVDVSGAGGTSWVGVETLRARARSQRLGELYWDWGVPTAASVAQLTDLGLSIIATGGVQHGLDIARAVALGATAGGMARPFLTAWNEGGLDAAMESGREVVDAIRVAHVLTGSRDIEALQAQPVLIGPSLARWVPRDTTLATRMQSVIAP